MKEWLSSAWQRLLTVSRRRQLDRDLDDELAHHLELRAKKNREAGMNSEEARYAARRQFGNVTRAK